MPGLEASLKTRAQAEGFASARVTRLAPDPLMAARLRGFIALGLHGDMGWMADTEARRADPTALWPAARSAVMLAMNYGPDSDPLARLKEKSTGVISVYALGRDYHAVMKGKLKRLAQWLAQESGAEVKIFVDTAPLMEKPLAEKAGLGWQGKHSNLVSRQLGSWIFLGAILTGAELAPDEAETDHCGSCRSCLDICPTRAFPAPYRLDARRCISYLTIEHKGHIAREFREAMGNRIYGCDDCLAVCPWNKFAQVASEVKLRARADLVAPPLAELLSLDDAGFRAKFSGSPVKRTGRDRFIRNVLIAAGNSDDISLLPAVEARLADLSPLIRAMAVWALARLAGAERFDVLRRRHEAGETDAEVKVEWQLR
ncbi:MAG: tRNA epoxyqueuosine(34) reductase QueG [Rhizobiales bacterium]|nr:tRNA epoxyqueuosine(34) reductase QueG [Hyphomicrobiales bacterium]MBI3673000.1 tRNA epoxyqueuosine(34) reductase QueG [Hyphomicrobiales bacterium]